MQRPSKDRWDAGDASITKLNICSSVNNRAVTFGEPERVQETYGGGKGAQHL